METTKRKAKPLKGKGGLVMVGVLAVLGLFIWWVQHYGPPPREPGAEAQAGDFMGLHRPESVTRVEVRGIAEPFTLERSGDNWRLTSPITVPANKQTVDDAVKGLVTASVGEHYTGGRVSSGELKQYGLDKPVAEIILTDGGRHVLQVGGAARQSQGLYVRETGDERVVVVPSFAVDALKGKKADDFRDKSALPIADVDKAIRVSVDGDKGKVEAARRGENWAITAPASAKADKSGVDSLVSSAKALQAQSFIPGGVKDLVKYGLDKPRLTFSVTDDKGEHTLLLGSQTTEKDPKIYAVRRGEQEVMLLPKSAMSDLNKGAADLHSRELLTFDTAKATRVTVRAPKGTYELVKKGTDWWLSKPISAKAESSKVQNLLSSLTGPATKFVAENPTDLAQYGLQSPAIQVTVDVSGEPESRYFMGSAAPGTEKNWYVRTSKSPAVFETSNYVYEDINQKPDDLKSK